MVRGADMVAGCGNCTDISREGTNYTVSSVQAGKDFADFLWSAYGPKAPGYTGPRPFGDNVISGFDFDIETKFGMFLAP